MFTKFFSEGKSKECADDSVQFAFDDDGGLMRIDIDESMLESAFDDLFSAPEDPRVIPPLLIEDFLYLNQEVVESMIPEMCPQTGQYLGNTYNGVKNLRSH